jgi:hypothetical protein
MTTEIILAQADRVLRLSGWNSDYYFSIAEYADSSRHKTESERSSCEGRSPLEVQAGYLETSCGTELLLAKNYVNKMINGP